MGVLPLFVAIPYYFFHFNEFRIERILLLLLLKAFILRLMSSDSKAYSLQNNSYI